MKFFNKLRKVLPHKSPEEIAFQKKLKAETQQAYRESYEKQAIKEARKRGREQARQSGGKPKSALSKVDAFLGINQPAKVMKQRRKQLQNVDNLFKGL